MPEQQPTYNTDDSPDTLKHVYPLGTYWDEDEQAFICELSAFGIQVHAGTWSDALNLGVEAQKFLITAYQSRNFVLPDL